MELQNYLQKKVLLPKTPMVLHPFGFYVYVAELDGVVYYIGKGSSWRYTHVNSGMSCCYELNREHFKGRTFNVYLMEDCLTEKEALELEKSAIIELKPVYNKNHSKTPQSTESS